MADLVIKTPRIFKPLLKNARYKGAKGGRGSGKSHFFAECIVERLIFDPDARIVCIREIQKSLKFSAKSLIESKINFFGVNERFEITQTEIKSKIGNGIIIFQGMQDHTADSIKSLENFDIAWVEEAQNLSSRSLELLRPTIRKTGAEIWFSWNPENETDAVDRFFGDLKRNGAYNYILVTANYYDNPFLPQTLKNEIEYDRKYNISSFNHIWEGGYNTRKDSLIFKDNFEIRDFITPPEAVFYHGLDFGFSKDPTAAIRCFIKDEILYIDAESGAVELALDETAEFLSLKIETLKTYTVRADSARPESINYLARHGLPHIVGVKKWQNSIIDGIEFIKSFKKIVIHERCYQTIKEFSNYSYKIDKASGDILPQILDENNHYIDALRYALEPLIFKRGLKITGLREFL